MADARVGFMKRTILAAAMLLAVGCTANRTADKTILPLTRVPTAVRNAAYGQLPGIRFHTAYRLPNGDYQLRGLDAKGANADFLFTPDGQLLTPR